MNYHQLNKQILILPFITADKTGPKHINIKMTRAKLEALVEDLIAKTMPPCKTALKDAGISASEVEMKLLWLVV